jgi:WD40 repeat protein
VFLAGALGAGGFAFIQSQQAQAEAARADAAADEADRERQSAERAARLNRSRELAASAIAQLDGDPTLARLLALSAATIVEPPEETVAALRRAIAEDRVLDTYAWPEDRPIDTFAPALHPGGDLIALGGAGSTMFDVVDRQTGAVLWSHDAGAGLWMSPPMFSRDGEILAVAIGSDGESRDIPAPDRIGLFIWRADSGELIRRLDGGTCGPELAALSDAYAVIATAPDDVVTENGSCFHLEWTARELIDLTSGQRTLLTRDGDGAALNADGSVVAYDDHASNVPESIVAETATAERLLTLDPFDLADGLNSWVRGLSPEGDLLIYGDRPIRIWDVTAGERIGFFHGHGGFAFGLAFAEDGASVYTAGVDSRLRHWDARTGEEIRSFGPVTPERVTISTTSALATREGGTAALFDLGVRGEVGAVETCRGFVLSETLKVVDSQATLGVAGCTGEEIEIDSLVVDLASGAVVLGIPEQGAQAIALSPDGIRLVRQEGTYPEFGSVTIRDVKSGDILTVLDGTCTFDTTGERDEDGIPLGCNAIPEPPFPVWPWELVWSPDGDLIVAVNDTLDARGGLAVWDAGDGALRFAEDVGRDAGDLQVVLSATFTPDGEELIVATMDEDASPDGDVVSFRRYVSDTGELLDVLPIDGLRGDLEGFGIRFIGYSADDSTLFAVDRPQRGGVLVAIDLQTLEVMRTRGEVTDAQAKSYSISPDRSRIATGTSDGYVRVWDSETFRLDQEFFVADTPVQGLAFVSDTHLAVAPEQGDILVYTVDVDELVSLARQSLTRGFTPEECERFNFGDDCPTLEELQAGS